MNMDFREIRQILSDSAQSFGRDRNDRQRAKLFAVGQQSFRADIWVEMAELGWLGLALPERTGGSGLGLYETGLVCEALGAAMMPEPLLGCAILPGNILGGLTDSETLNLLASDLDRGTQPLAVASHRLGAGADEAAIELDDGGLLHGRCDFVSGVAVADRILVEARRGDVPLMLIVDRDGAGLTEQRHRAADGGSLSSLIFEGSAGLIIDEGHHIPDVVDTAIDRTRLTTAAYLTGVADAAKQIITDHLRTRVQFGRTLSSFQTLRHATVDMMMATELARASWHRAAHAIDGNGLDEAAIAAISAAKHRAGRTAIGAGLRAVQYLGGLGFAEEADAGLALRIAQQWNAWLGGDRMLMRRFQRASERIA